MTKAINHIILVCIILTIINDSRTDAWDNVLHFMCQLEISTRYKNKNKNNKQNQQSYVLRREAEQKYEPSWIHGLTCHKNPW